MVLTRHRTASVGRPGSATLAAVTALVQVRAGFGAVPQRHPPPLERLSIEVTRSCGKGCWFCYNGSNPSGSTRWTVDDLVGLVSDCAAHGVRAVSLGGGEPLEFEGIFEVLERTAGTMFRSLTTNGLLLDAAFRALTRAAPDKVHVSIHFPGRAAEVERAARWVSRLRSASIRAGVNLLVRRSRLDEARACAATLRAAGIGNDSIVYLPMRGQETPTPDELAVVAGRMPFQSMSCMLQCAASPRFAAIGWDRRVAWCSYTASRRPLSSLDYDGLCAALKGLQLQTCGGATT